MRTPRSEKKSTAEFVRGPWRIGYNLRDGGRITCLTYGRFGLLTPAPVRFTPPRKAHGRFEDRPVYGYDDCFPSVVACYFPGTRISIPDHGELCWLPWEVAESEQGLSFTVKSKLLPFVFKRTMKFSDSVLVWDFEVVNEGKEVMPFQHSMHPLLPADDIRRIVLPQFKSVFDWNSNSHTKMTTPEEVSDRLLNGADGSVDMLFVRAIEKGEMAWTYSNGLSVRVIFPVEYFPTIGIWWDGGGYPDEEGLRRSECAFEPTAGSTSLLSRAHADGESLSVPAGGSFSWQVVWEMSIE